MAKRLDFAAYALIGQALGAGLLTRLWQKGLLSDDDVRELADGALLDLERWQALFPGNQEDFAEARQFFETYVKSLPQADNDPPGSSG